MPQVPHVTYGLGGFDPKKPNNNIVASVIVDVPDPDPSPVDVLTSALIAKGVITKADVDNADSASTASVSPQ